MVNAYVLPNLIVNSTWYVKALFNANHETFHIMYNELVWKGDYSKRIVWYDEGMAQFLSGECDHLMDDEKFKDYFEKVKSSTKFFPDLNSICHGNTFCNENYNGYDLSYLSVRYLYETLSLDEFKGLLKDLDKVKQYGKNIANEAFAYFEEKLYGLSK